MPDVLFVVAPSWAFSKAAFSFRSCELKQAFHSICDKAPTPIMDELGDIRISSLRCQAQVL